MENPWQLLSKDAEIIESLQLEESPRGTISRYWLHLVTDGMGLPIYVPIIVARGQEEGPTLGLTAAVHGNELNGIPIIQRIFKEIDPGQLTGTIVGVPVVNIPALHRNQRRFIDGTDLNHIFPGRSDGNVSQVYAHRILHTIIRDFDYLVDLHTASFGRENSYYIRADLQDTVTRDMALLQNAQIIVHNPPSDGTLRGAADEMGIHAITLEVGDPNTFQKGVIRSSLTGVHNLLNYIGMVESESEEAPQAPVICGSSYWVYADNGGILTVLPKTTQRVKAGEPIALLRNIFGDIIREYTAPEDGIVIGRSVNPINQTGGRILHLGIIE